MSREKDDAAVPQIQSASHYAKPDDRGDFRLYCDEQQGHYHAGIAVVSGHDIEFCPFCGGDLHVA